MLHTYMEEVLSIDDRDRIGAETVQTLTDTHLTKCIWDVREAKLGYSLFDVHQSILRARDDFRSKEHNYVAIIYHHNQTEFEHAKTAAYNRGIPNIDFFMDIDEGIRWLADKT